MIAFWTEHVRRTTITPCYKIDFFSKCCNYPDFFPQNLLAALKWGPIADKHHEPPTAIYQLQLPAKHTWDNYMWYTQTRADLNTLNGGFY